MAEKYVSITVSDVIEYMFCPRFIYFMYCLDIPQHEEQRFKVQKGRDIHKFKSNAKYLRKKLGAIRKETNVYLSSKKHLIRGIVDEVLFLRDGTAAPLDYKYARYEEKVFRTYKNQITLYGLMISEVYDVEVNRGFICYVRSNNLVKELDILQRDIEKSIKVIRDILGIIQTGLIPKKTRTRMKCVDCCYRNICC